MERVPLREGALGEDFEQGEEEFVETMGLVTQSLQAFVACEGMAARRRAEAETNALMAKAEQAIFCMEGAIRSISSSKSIPMRKRLDSCRNQLNRQQMAFRKARLHGSAAARKGLRGEGRSDLEMGKAEASLRRSDQSLDTSDESLQRSLRLAAESERMGSQTLENLRLQRETLEHGSAKLDEVNASMDVGDRYLRTMARRLVTNKITLVLIILALLLCVGLLIYFKVR